MRCALARAGFLLAFALISAGHFSTSPALGDGGAPSSSVREGKNIGEVPDRFRIYAVRGGYTAAGIGMRNRGSGSITITDIPQGAQVVEAYLYWAVLGGSTRANRGSFQGHPIKGTPLGTSDGPCWPSSENRWPSASFRADVTRWVKGNGTFQLDGFDSAIKNGRDPFSAPANIRKPSVDGATLVLIYSGAGTRQRILLYDGNALTDGERNVLTAEMTGFGSLGRNGRARTTFIVADGQTNYPEPGARVNGRRLPGVSFDGADPQEGNDFLFGNLWDTLTMEISRFFRGDPKSVTISIQGGGLRGPADSGDCLVWVAQVLSVEQ